MSNDGSARREHLRRHLRLIDDGVRPVMQRYPEQVQCGPGCSDCCHQTFRVSGPEGELLREGLATLDEPVRAELLNKAEAYQPDTRTPCPVLDGEGRCGLYEFRPRICRKYGIPLWHPDRPQEVRCCELNFRSMGDIDADLILEPQAKWAEEWIEFRRTHDPEKGPNRTIAEHLTQALGD